jgi:hypothetical protein
MGSSLLAMPANAMGQVPEPVLRVADRLLDLLFEETKRLIKEKEFAVHALASALLEKGELIGSELDTVFEHAELAHPESAGPFERRPITLPKPFEESDGVRSRVPVQLPAAAAVEPPARKSE